MFVLDEEEGTSLQRCGLILPSKSEQDISKWFTSQEFSLLTAMFSHLCESVRN